MPEGIDPDRGRLPIRGPQLPAQCIERLGGMLHQLIGVHLETAVRCCMDLIGCLMTEAVDLTSVRAEEQGANRGSTDVEGGDERSWWQVAVIAASVL